MVFKVKGQLNVVFDELEIEADSREDLLDKLRTITADTVITDGYVKDTEVVDVDIEVEEAHFVVKVSDIDYDIRTSDVYDAYEAENGEITNEVSEEDYRKYYNKIYDTLPKVVTVEVESTPGYAECDAIDKVTEMTGWLINSATTEIIETK